MKSYIIMPPDVYGFGTGLFTIHSLQIPELVSDAIKHGQAAYVGVGDGSGDVGHVHVRDLAALYEILLGKILDGVKCASGKDGIYFCNAGRHTWRDVATSIGTIGRRMGVLNSEVPASIGIEEAAQRWTGGDERYLRMGYCSQYVD